MRLVKVTWIDSGLFLEEGWAPIEDYIVKAREHGLTVETVGLLAYEDGEMLAIGTSRDTGNDTILGVQVIHRANVLSVEDLHLTHPPRLDLPSGTKTLFGMVP